MGKLEQRWFFSIGGLAGFLCFKHWYDFLVVLVLLTIADKLCEKLIGRQP